MLDPTSMFKMCVCMYNKFWCVCKKPKEIAADSCSFDYT